MGKSQNNGWTVHNSPSQTLTSEVLWDSIRIQKSPNLPNIVVKHGK